MKKRKSFDSKKIKLYLICGVLILVVLFLFWHFALLSSTSNVGREASTISDNLCSNVQIFKILPSYDTCVSGDRVFVNVKKEFDFVNLTSVKVLIYTPNYIFTEIFDGKYFPSNSSLLEADGTRTVILRNLGYQSATRVELVPVVKIGSDDFNCESSSIDLKKCD